MGYGGYYGFAPYVSVAERRRKAEKEAARLAKKGRILAPVQPSGRLIAKTFWGKAWCDHLEKHGDYANRLPRGRTYARNGSVIDLQVRAGEVTALVSGSSIYEVRVAIEPLVASRWAGMARDCAGHIDSLVELLQGRLDKGVLARLCHEQEGMFPQPRQMTFRCSCPDGASMCKHVAAALYGIGHRLDSAPELLFVLRQVDQHELVRRAAHAPVAVTTPSDRMLDEASLGDVFGVELDAADMGPLPMLADLIAPKHVEKAVAPLRRPPGRKPMAATAFVLKTLRQFKDNELRLVDIREHGAGRFPQERLLAVLAELHGKGLVDRSVEDGTEWWAISVSGGHDA